MKENSPEDQDVSVFEQRERLQRLHDDYGFYPRSSDELSTMTSLVKRSGETYPVLGFLDSVFIHQQRAGADGAATLRSFVHRYAEFAGNALNEQDYMVHVIKQLDQPPIDDGSDILSPQEWRYDTTLRASLKSLSRSIEIEQLTGGEVAHISQKRDDIDQLTGEDLVERIQQTLQPFTSDELMAAARQHYLSQEQRFIYWYAAVKESARHFHARSTAEAEQAALDDIARS